MSLPNNLFIIVLFFVFFYYVKLAKFRHAMEMWIVKIVTGGNPLLSVEMAMRQVIPKFVSDRFHPTLYRLF